MSVDSALAAVLDADSPDRRRHIRLLIDSAEDGLDDRIMALLDGEHHRAASVLCRILAERDPERDPSYVLRRFGGDQPVRWFRKWVRDQAYNHPLGVAYGIPRLRRARPVDHYARGAGHWWAVRRVSAAIALGDTADPAAVPHVVRLLGDRHRDVRAQAAVAIRRLARDGALPVGALDQVADGLVGLLSDPVPAVVEHAAAALATPALRERLVEARNSAGLPPAAVSAVDAALAGGGPPLRPSWEGDPGEVHG